MKDSETSHEFKDRELNLYMLMARALQNSNIIHLSKLTQLVTILRIGPTSWTPG